MAMVMSDEGFAHIKKEKIRYVYGGEALQLKTSG
jgi:hypothetical protein